VCVRRKLNAREKRKKVNNQTATEQRPILHGGNTTMKPRSALTQTAVTDAMVNTIPKKQEPQQRQQLQKTRPKKKHDDQDTGSTKSIVRSVCASRADTTSEAQHETATQHHDHQYQEKKAAEEEQARKYAQERAAARVTAALRAQAQALKKQEEEEEAKMADLYESVEEREMRLKADREKAKARARVKAQMYRQQQEREARERENDKRKKEAAFEDLNRDDRVEEELPEAAQHHTRRHHSMDLETFQRQTKERLQRYILIVNGFVHKKRASVYSSGHRTPLDLLSIVSTPLYKYIYIYKCTRVQAQKRMAEKARLEQLQKDELEKQRWKELKEEEAEEAKARAEELRKETRRRLKAMEEHKLALQKYDMQYPSICREVNIRCVKVVSNQTE
jgi:hypothetical protein